MEFKKSYYFVLLLIIVGLLATFIVYKKSKVSNDIKLLDFTKEEIREEEQYSTEIDHLEYGENLFSNYMTDSFPQDDFLHQEFCRKYDLPSDFSKAIKYIDSELDGMHVREAYNQLIVDNPESFYFDFNTIDEAPHYDSSPDGKFRIYRFYYGMHEDPPILQFCNSKGKIVTKHLSTAPLDKEAEGEVVTDDDYRQGHFCAYARVLGQIEIDGVETYILFISDYIYEYVRHCPDPSNVLCEFVTGMQLTETGYKYVDIFENPSSGYIYTARAETYNIDRVRAVNIFWASEHNNAGYGDAWYDAKKQVLYIPNSVENYQEIFDVFKWDKSAHKFERLRDSAYENSHKIHESLKRTCGLEIIMYFENLIVRVDNYDPSHNKYEHQYRYASWGNGKTIIDEPDLIIYNGNLNKTDGTFHFHNNGYEYIVPCAENRFNNKLIVKKNGDVILQKEIKLEYEEN